MVDVQWAFISIATTSLAHFILRIVLGRELGAEGLGIYTLAFTIYLFGMQFAAFGIGSALTKFVAEFIDDRATVHRYVSSGMTSSIITGGIMGIGVFLLAPIIATNLFHTPELEGMIQMTAFCYPFIAVQKAVLGTLNGFRRMYLYAALSVVQNVTVVALSMSLVLLLGMGVMGGIIGLVLATILVSALSPLLIRDRIRLDKSLWDIPALHATAVFGFYVVLSNSVSYLNTQIDSILIGYYLDPVEVGIYAVAVLLAQTLTLIPSAIQRVTAPVTATLYGKGDARGVRNIFFSTLKKVLFISFCSAILIAVFGPYIISIIFSETFSSSYIPLLILLPGYAINASIGSVGSTLSSIGKVRVPFRISTVCMILNVIMNIILIPFIGINGAAVATSISLIAEFILIFILTCKYV